MRWIIGAAILVTIVVIAGGWLISNGKTETSFRTVQVTRGEMLATISATGTVEPEEVIDVGAQVAGQILSFGKDPKNPDKDVDYRSTVEEGTVLARIDDATYQADVQNAQAMLDQAVANVARAEADLVQLNANLFKAERDWNRAQELKSSNALAQTQIDTYEAAWRTAAANVKVGAAVIDQTKAAISSAKATLSKAKRNLDFCTIKSPVKGTIIDRRVNVGQTVVASLNTPSLFLIAKDLRRMEVWASVNEADIGNVHPGQVVTLTVDAYPGRTFHGKVEKVRLNATMTQNVVTYTVEVSTENPDEKLWPYMTANLSFEVARHADVLMVTNAALRWQPRDEQIAQDVGPEHRRSTTGPTTRRSDSRESGKVWIIDGDRVRPIKVKLGPSDGTNTEIRGEGVAENLEVVIGENQTQADSGTEGQRNPFVPQRPRR